MNCAHRTMPDVREHRDRGGSAHRWSKRRGDKWGREPCVLRFHTRLRVTFRQFAWELKLSTITEAWVQRALAPRLLVEVRDLPGPWRFSTILPAPAREIS